MFEDVIHPIFLDLRWHPVGGRFYCPVCISNAKPPAQVGWGNRTAVVNHLGSSHGWDEPRIADALSSNELTQALMAWREDVEVLGDDFAGDLRLVRGVADFLEECET